MNDNAPKQQIPFRVRPGDAGWPSQESWERLNRSVGGRLIRVQSPLDLYHEVADRWSLSDFYRELRNPFFIGEHAGLTQTSGWVDGWASTQSAYAVAARTSDHVVAAVKFARDHNLRLVVRGGGHSYKGTSNAADALLIWMREMKDITLHDAFVGQGCDGEQLPQPAVTVEAGAIWLAVYDAVTTRGGRYVQGAGCLTVSAAGLIQSGGFGSFSKTYGLAAAGLLEAEIVTADGAVRTANARTNADLFWGIKGGGGGSLGVITKLTLRTRELPDHFGTVVGQIRAASDAAFRKLIARAIEFYHRSLFNHCWGERLIFGPDRTIKIDMVFQGLDRSQAQDVWRPFLVWLATSTEDFSLENPVTIVSIPARHFWNPEYLKKFLPNTLVLDDRPGSPKVNMVWAGDSDRVGQFIHGYRSVWLPAALLRLDRQQRLVDALFASTRHWGVVLHFNKGLAGAPEEELTAASDTAMNPAALGAFALATCNAEGPPSFLGLPGPEPDQRTARHQADLVKKAMDEVLKIVPAAASYVAESDFFECNWQQSFWGPHYLKLAAIKKKYDPTGLFFVHHGVGSEEWHPDGFVRLLDR